MPWTPNASVPNGLFEGQIAENVLTILTRDFHDALEHYYPADDLANFAELELGPALRNVFPCGAIEPVSNTIEESEDGSHFLQEARVRIYIAVTGDGPKATTRKLEKYVRVATLVLLNAKNDFRTGMSNPFGVVLMRFEHFYDVVRSEETIIARAAAVEMSIALRER